MLRLVTPWGEVITRVVAPPPSSRTALPLARYMRMLACITNKDVLMFELGIAVAHVIDLLTVHCVCIAHKSLLYVLRNRLWHIGNATAHRIGMGSTVNGLLMLPAQNRPAIF